MLGGYLLLAICAIGAFYGQHLARKGHRMRSQAQEAKSQESTSVLIGRLEAENKPLTENIIHVYVGTNVSSLSTKEEFEDKGTWLPQVKLSFKNGKVLLSADIISSDGKTIAYVKNNEFKVNEKNESYFESNRDEYGLEIIDQFNLPVLQIEFLDRYTIKIAGLFFAQNNITYATDYGKIGFKPDEYEAYTDEIRSLLKKQQKLFLYPSELHSGQRAYIDEALQSKQYLDAKEEFSQFTNEKLKEITGRIVSGIRRFLDSHSELPLTIRSESRTEKGEDAANSTEVKIEMVKKMTELIAKRQALYDGAFRPYTIVARDELLLRLPNKTEREEYSLLYERATSSHEYETVANDLERLAQIL